MDVLVSDDNFVGDFCCKEMEIYSTKPQKCVSFDPWYKRYDNDPIRFAACIHPLEKAGLATDQGFSSERSGKAGYRMVLIDYCPWCGKKIEFG